MWREHCFADSLAEPIQLGLRILMHRAGLLLLLAASSCTHVQLTSSTVQTASTVMEIQYQMIMDNLARMIRNPATLPSHVRIKQGTVQVSDQLGLYRLQVSGTLSGAFGGPRAERTVSEQWGADAISDPRTVKQLQDVYRAAMRLKPMAAPSFIAFEQAGDASQKSLRNKSTRTTPDHQVTFDLQSDVPQGWFHVGAKSQVPRNAIYVGHSEDQYVWVDPENLDGLSQFTLVILFITKLGPGENKDTGVGLVYTGGK